MFDYYIIDYDTEPTIDEIKLALKYFKCNGYRLMKDEKKLFVIQTRRQHLVYGIVCNKCKNTLPPHTQEDHLNISHPIHKCPHNVLE
jgi:hypothetical protein